jgi:hypothetical protein
MSEPTIQCPKCHTEFKLNESLAAPLIASVTRDYERRLAQQSSAFASKENALHEKERQIEQAQMNLNAQVAERVSEQVKSAREAIATEEANKAKLLAQDAINSAKSEADTLKELLKSKDEKLAEAQSAQAEFLKKQRDLDESKRELDLTIEKRINEGLSLARDTAKKEAEDGLKLKLLEKDQAMLSMQKKIEELKQKADQGSQQLQGEVQELDLEQSLQAKFPFDQVSPVPKGTLGADVIQRVVNEQAQDCGVILWESKRTRTWTEGWLAKLREDQRSCKAEIAIIVSQTLPKGVSQFEFIDGIWVVSPAVAIPVASMLRDTLIRVSMARAVSLGQKTKAEMVYEYLTGAGFRQRVEAIVEACTIMREDKEKRSIMQQWSKRETQIEQVMKSTLGMYGDMQGIAGRSLQEIEGLSLDAEPIALDKPNET